MVVVIPVLIVLTKSIPLTLNINTSFESVISFFLYVIFFVIVFSVIFFNYAHLVYVYVYIYFIFMEVIRF